MADISAGSSQNRVDISDHDGRPLPQEAPIAVDSELCRTLHRRGQVVTPETLLKNMCADRMDIIGMPRGK